VSEAKRGGGERRFQIWTETLTGHDTSATSPGTPAERAPASRTRSARRAPRRITKVRITR
jgi:hypothetical protein